MWQGISLFPDRASTVAGDVDHLLLFLLGVAIFFSVLITALIVGFAARYRRTSANRKAVQIEGSLRLELLWTLIPLGLTMIMFAWGATLYYDVARPPAGAMRFDVTAKQWMWRIQHPTGHREINEMHVPVHTPIQIWMTSEDVIHSFFVPAFRTKQDVVPGRYSTTWFEATRVGEYHLFCAEYCGTKHSKMIGKVVVMEPEDYERWLAGRTADESPVERGERLFTSLRCDTCHAAGAEQRGPVLAGRFGSEVQLDGGGTVTFDADYVRESILRPKAKLVAGYKALMPTFEGQVSEDDILGLTAWLRSQTPETPATPQTEDQP